MAMLRSAGASGGRQIPALDGIRGLAILSVLLIHLQQVGVVPERFHMANVLMHAGWCGVDLFFVLSGFLITLGLLDSKGSSNYFSTFYMRRLLRIFPLYYLVVLAAMVCSVFFAHWSPATPLFSDAVGGSIFPTWKGWISHLLYFQNWWMPWKEPDSQNILGHFWSLGIEEQFYLLWPLCVWLLPERRLPAVCGGVCAAVLALRFGLVGLFHVPQHVVFMNTVTRADTLIVGAFCAVAARNGGLLAKARRWLPVAAVAGSCYMVVVALGLKDKQAQIYWTQTLGFTALALTFGPLVLWAYLRSGGGGWYDRVLSIRPLTGLGKYSYGLYVYHVPVIILAKILFGKSPWFGKDLVLGGLFSVVTVAVAIGVAVLSYQLFEQRFLRLKRYFRPSYRGVAGHESAGAAAAASETTPVRAG
jgi:peptidoglycan/LPS O-acetylase OafA/YrhL